MIFKRCLLAVMLILIGQTAVYAQNNGGEMPAFAAVRNGGAIVLGDGTVLTELAGGQVASLAWTPDGSALVYVEYDGGLGPRVMVLEDGGDSFALDTGALEAGFPLAFTPDGEILYAQSTFDPANPPESEYRVNLNVIAPEPDAAPRTLGSVPFGSGCGGGSPIPADWLYWGESGFGGGYVTLAWTDYGILHSVNCGGQGAALFDPATGTDTVLTDDSEQTYVGRLALAPDGRTAAGILSAYDEPDPVEQPVLIDLETRVITRLESAAQPEQIAWGYDGGLYYSTRLAKGDLLKALSPHERRTFETQTGGSGMSVPAWTVEIHRIDLETGEDETVYEVDAYQIGRMRTAPDGRLWFSAIGNLDAWVEAVVSGETDGVSPELDTAYVPVTIYSLDTGMRNAYWIAENLTRFALRPPQGEALVPGEVIHRALTPWALSQDYTFEGQAGEIFAVAASGSPAFLKAVILTAPDGSTIMDIRDYFDPRMDSGYVQLAQSGAHRVTILGDQPTRYDLRLLKREPPLLSYTADTGEAGRDYLYDTVQELPFAFEGQAGDEIIAWALSENVDTVLTLVSPAGEELAVDDDSGRNLQARIGPYRLPESGLYRLILRPYETDESGGVWVSVGRAQPPREDEIAYGQERRADQDMVLRLEADPGDVIALHVEGGGDNAEVRIEDRESRIVTSSVRNPRALFPDPERVALAGGRYEVRVLVNEATLTEPVRFRLERLGTHSLDFTNLSETNSQQLTVFMNTKAPVATFSFHDGGSNGVRLWVRQGWNDRISSPFRIVVEQDGAVIASYTVDEVRGLRGVEVEVVFNPSRSGEAQVRLELLGDGPVWFSLARELMYGIG